MGKLTILTVSLVLSGLIMGAARAGTLESLERERALVLEILLDFQLTPEERAERLSSVRIRLIDLERMVVRDKSLRGRNTPTVRRAFENYELTFLAHAAAERNATLLDIWFDQLALNREAVMSARKGWR